MSIFRGGERVLCIEDKGGGVKGGDGKGGTYIHFSLRIHAPTMLAAMALTYLGALVLAALILNKCCSRTGGYERCFQLAWCCGSSLVLLLLYIGVIIVIAKIDEA